MHSKESSFIPLYKKLYEQYKNAILTQQYPPGEQIDSINQIQQRFSVSRETAKIVLRKLADEGLIVQKAGKGSFISDLGPRKAIWGVIVPYYSAQIEKVISELNRAANKENRSLDHYVSHNSWKEEIRLVGIMINQRYEAVIVMPTFDETKTADFYRHLVSGGTVVTLLDHTMTGSYFTYAIQSYDLGVNRAFHYLCEKSKRNFAFVKNDIWAGRNMVLEFMEATFKNFVELESPNRQAITLDSVHEMDATFLDLNNIDGIFCCDDMDAVRVVGKLKEWGYVLPNDIALISYGNTDLARYFTPQITSIDSHCEEMVAKTIDIIHAHLNGEDVRYSQFVVQPELIIRQT
jgi:DNA-binding LacI/PurR family transcriptional regulator